MTTPIQSVPEVLTYTMELPEMREHILSFLPPSDIWRSSLVSQSFAATADRLLGDQAAQGNAASFSILKRIINYRSPEACKATLFRLFNTATPKAQNAIWQELSEEEILAWLPYLPEQLSELYLEGCYHLSTETLIKIAAQFPQTSVLNLNDSLNSASPGELVHFLEKLHTVAPQLRSLALSSITALRAVHVQQVAENWPELQSLDISHCNFLNDEIAEALSQLRLSSVNLSGLRISDTTLQSLHQSPLRQLSIGNCVQLSAVAFQELLKHCPELHHLDAWGLNSRASAAVLAAITRTGHSFSHIELSHLEQVPTEVFEKFSQSQSKLAALSLGDATNLSDETAAHLVTASAGLSSILIQHSPRIRQATLHALAEQRNLTELILEGDNLLEESAIAMLATRLPLLEHLSLTKSGAISNQTLLQFIHSNPRLVMLCVTLNEKPLPSLWRELITQLPGLTHLVVDGPFTVSQSICSELEEGLPLLKVLSLPREAQIDDDRDTTQQ